MCFGGGGGNTTKKKKKNEAADSLKIAKQKETKNFSNPTITTAQKLTQTKKKTLI